jgi:hypothetical protein
VNCPPCSKDYLNSGSIWPGCLLLFITFHRILLHHLQHDIVRYFMKNQPILPHALWILYHVLTLFFRIMYKLLIFPWISVSKHVHKYVSGRHGVFVFGIRIRMYSNTNSKVFVFVFEYFLKYSDSEYFHEYFMNTSWKYWS